MILPGDKDPQTVQVEKVLHNAITLRGRSSRVVLVCDVDEYNKLNESKSDLTIPGLVSICTVCRSPRLLSQGVVGKSGLPST